MADEEDPQSSASGSSSWDDQLKNFARMAAASAEMSKLYERHRAVTSQLVDRVIIDQVLKNLEIGQRAVDYSAIEAAMSSVVHNHKIAEYAAQIFARAYPLLQTQVGKLSPPQSPTSEAESDAEEFEEALSAIEAVREETRAEELEPAIETFFEDNSDFEDGVTGLAGLTNVTDPEVQRRVKVVVRWIIYLAVIAFIAGNFAAALAVSSVLSLFGISVKDVQQTVESLLQQFMDKQTDDGEEDEFEDEQ